VVGLEVRSKRRQRGAVECRKSVVRLRDYLSLGGDVSVDSLGVARQGVGIMMVRGSRMWEHRRSDLRASRHEVALWS
jgi:hypothetical protein